MFRDNHINCDLSPYNDVAILCYSQVSWNPGLMREVTVKPIDHSHNWSCSQNRYIYTIKAVLPNSSIPLAVLTFLHHCLCGCLSFHNFVVFRIRVADLANNIISKYEKFVYFPCILVVYGSHRDSLFSIIPVPFQMSVCVFTIENINLFFQKLFSYSFKTWALPFDNLTLLLKIKASLCGFQTWV